MERRKVTYEVIYNGKAEPKTVDIIPGKRYKCIAEVYDGKNLHDLAIIDESEEDYLYDPEDFKKI